ncbi:energy-converting NiFe hydrogenase A subunit EhaA [Methanothermococcus sp.]|uniref:energy-converting NiFe hydrogenase A subunit EhaA n=1 Tax=Methanothermococcus sp. TaxID=2614238 RepID=UPI0025FDBF65|nr:energy-converting NiFe hydrogenase A subunit EhaA [Methanothermococcus sp.]
MNVPYTLIYFYGISIISSIIIGILLKMPLKPNTNSFEGNILFPTVFVALGLTAIAEFLFGLDIILCVIIGVFSALFSKYINRIFPGVDYGN